MEEYSCITDKGESVEVINYEPIKIELNSIVYELNIETNENSISLSINDKELLLSMNYKRTMTFKEIKDLNYLFGILKTFNDFYDYLKSLSDIKKLGIRKTNDKISLILNIEVLLKPQIIEIDLFPTKNNIDINSKESYKELLNLKENMKEMIKVINILKNNYNEQKKEIDILKSKNDEKEIEINNLKNEAKIKDKELNDRINLLNKEIKELKETIGKQNKEIPELKAELKKEKKTLQENNKYYYFDNSTIMNKDERYMVFSEIENKMEKQISSIKKLYQATIDGGEPNNFHMKCDNIPNTLVLIKSEGLRRFGGFTPVPWKSEGGYKKDPDMKTFVFSLDKLNIYYLKNERKSAVFHNKDSGPCFGGGRDIAIDNNPIKENSMYTRENSFNYKGNKICLSEYNAQGKIKAFEYEVFQILF